MTHLQIVQTATGYSIQRIIPWDCGHATCYSTKEIAHVTTEAAAKALLMISPRTES